MIYRHSSNLGHDMAT